MRLTKQKSSSWDKYYWPGWICAAVPRSASALEMTLRRPSRKLLAEALNVEPAAASTPKLRLPASECLYPAIARIWFDWQYNGAEALACRSVSKDA
jgi:hypothetical protein